MDLERCAAVLRPRKSWEAVDLGWTLTRHFWPTMAVALLLGALPAYGAGIALTAAGLIPGWLALLAVWWLRPFLDRLPLFAISRAFFGAAPTASEMRAAFWSWWLRDVFHDLTWRRLDPQRSYLAPISLLEGSAGSGAGRRGIFQRRGGEAAFALTLACWLAEMAMVAACAGLLVLLVPGSAVEEWLTMLGEDSATGWTLFMVLAFLAFLAFLLVEPFYVGAGFALYVQRRVELEGWDLELAFRRLARRLQPSSGRPSPSATGGPGSVRSPPSLVALLLAGALFASPARSEESAPYPPPVTIRSVLEDPVFGGKRTEWQWTLRGSSSTEATPASAWPAVRPSALPSPGALLALLLLGGGALVALHFWRRLPALEANTLRTPSQQAPGVGIPFHRRLSLPPDVAAAAGRLAREGRGEEAIGLLYRGALSALEARGQLPGRDDFTEGDCLDFLVQRRQATLASALEAIVRAWHQAAYGHRSPALEKIDELCELFRQHFRVAAAARSAEAPPARRSA